MQPHVALQVDLGLPEHSVIQSFNDLGLVAWLLELAIGAVYPVLDAEPAVAGVELEVVEVVELGGEGEGEVVAGVVIHHLEQQGDICIQEIPE